MEEDPANEDMVGVESGTDAGTFNGGPAGHTPLRRGDACLACRRRRIRCTAEKPHCANCLRLKKQCIYDRGKTSHTRIAELQARINELEKHFHSPTSPMDNAPSAQPPDLETPLARQMQSGPHTQSFSQGQTSISFAEAAFGTAPAFQGVVPTDLHSSFDPGNDYASVMNGELPASLTNYDFGLLDRNVIDLSQAMSSVNTDYNMMSSNSDAHFIPASGTPFPTPTSGPTHQEENSLIGGWFDPTDIPHPVRDHLLDLYFSRHGLFSVPIAAAGFVAQLTLPPAKRPSPALLYAMYVIGSERSTHRSLQRLQSTFVDICEKQIRQAVACNDRLLDTIRAMIILANHYFMHEEYNTGYHMTAQACRLCITCGLHRVPTSVWHSPKQVNFVKSLTLRTSVYALCPPETPDELASRILTFWVAYVMDVCSSVSYQYDPVFRLEDITTPLPRPFDHYRLGLVSKQDDVTLLSYLRNPSPPRRSDDSFPVTRIKALAYLSKVNSLKREPVEVELPEAMGEHAESIATPLTHPRATAEFRAGLRKLCDDLPQSYRCPWMDGWDEGIDVTLPRIVCSRDMAVMNVLVGAAYLHLWNIRIITNPNSRAVLVAKRLVSVICLFTDKLLGAFDLFLIMVWNDVAMVLMRELKRRERENIVTDDIRADLDIVVDSLKRWASHAISKVHEQADIAAFNTNMLDRLKSMSVEEWTEAFAEGEGDACWLLLHSPT